MAVTLTPHRGSWLRWAGAAGALSIAVLSPACGQVGGANSRPVFTDGRFPEWEAVPLAIDDPLDAPPDAAIDIGAVRILDDSLYVHLDIEVARVVSLQSMAGTLHVIFDADGDDQTGSTVYDLAGADLVLELSMRAPDAAGDQGAGIGIRRVSADGPGPVLSAYDLGVIIAPTFAASRFELRLDRNAAPDLGQLWTGDGFDMRLVFEDGSGVRDETATAVHRLSSRTGHPVAPAIQVPPKGAIMANGERNTPPLRLSEVVRVVQWNVAHMAIEANPRAFARVLAALSPDVIMLDEVYGDVSPESLDILFKEPPLAEQGSWHYEMGASGGTQRALIAASVAPLRGESLLLDVPYRDENLRNLEDDADGPRLRNLLARELRSGISVVGAWLARDVGGPLDEILFVTLDLQSGGYVGSLEDRLRVVQAATIAGRVRERTAGRQTGFSGVVIGGDFNLVGDFEPLDLLRAELGPLGRDLSIIDAPRLTERSLATWSNSRDIFTPGRLDYLLMGGPLIPRGAFTFDLSTMPAETLSALGLQEGDRYLSDHFPLVADLSWPDR